MPTSINACHETQEGVRRLFSTIARRYDLLNDLQSAGLHRRWKRCAVEALRLRAGDRVLDLACGTGDLTFRILDAAPGAAVVGGDYTLPMLRIAQGRAARPKGAFKSWAQLDGMRMPFRGAAFDAIAIAYGLRNMPDPLLALREMARVLKPGGRIAILEFGKPSNFLFRTLYYAFLRTYQPFLGWLFFRDAGTYRYIHESLRRYPDPERLRAMMDESGLDLVRLRTWGGGGMVLHVAQKRP